MKMFAIQQIKTVTTLILFLVVSLLAFSQQRILTLPVEFEKAALRAEGSNVHFLGNENGSSFALVLRNSKDIQYLRIDKDFKVTKRMEVQKSNTVFSGQDIQYRGGTTNDDISNFIYEDKESGGQPYAIFYLESVDFKSGAVKHTKLFQMPKAEEVLLSFSEANIFHIITAASKTSELVIYTVDPHGAYSSKRLPFAVPATAGRKKNTVSEYLSGIKLISSDKEAELSSVVSPAKMFRQQGKLQILVNDEINPAHIFTVELPSYKVTEKFIDFSNLDRGEKTKLTLNSYLKGDSLYSVLFDWKSLRVARHDLRTGKLQGTYELARDASLKDFAVIPESVSRSGNKTQRREVEDVLTLFRSMTLTTEGIIVTENKQGQLVVTVGTHDHFASQVSTGGSSMGGYESRITGRNSDGTYRGQMVYNPQKYNTPGTFHSSSSFVSISSKFLFNPSTMKPERGVVEKSIAEQVNNYVLNAEKWKLKAASQFSISGRQFYGYYDVESKVYVIEEINIRR